MCPVEAEMMEWTVTTDCTCDQDQGWSDYRQGTFLVWAYSTLSYSLCQVDESALIPRARRY